MDYTLFSIFECFLYDSVVRACFKTKLLKITSNSFSFPVFILFNLIKYAFDFDWCEKFKSANGFVFEYS